MKPRAKPLVHFVPATARHEPGRVLATLPLRLVNITNTREHHMARARRTKAQRAAVRAMLSKAIRDACVELPCIVTLTRIAPRAFDCDGAVAAFKGIRDEIAALLGVDDGSPMIEWQYAQRKSEPHTYGAEIRVERRG